MWSPNITAPRLVPGHYSIPTRPILPHTDFASALLAVHRPRPANALPQHNEIYERIATPYNARAIKTFLESSGTPPDLIYRNLTEGFALGNLPKLAETIVLDNHPSVKSHPEIAMEYVEGEVAAGRMSGPFATVEDVERILRGPFRSSPLIIAESSQGPDLPPKFRVCRNLSKGDVDAGLLAVNDMIDKAAFPTHLDDATRMAEWVANCPDGTLSCSLDLAKFHRTIPAHPDHKAYLVVHIHGQFYIDHCIPFGACSASSSAGQVGEVIVAALQENGVMPSFRYEDDISASVTPSLHGTYRVGDLCYLHDRDSALASLEHFDIPWSVPKCEPSFSPLSTWIGFEWDFAARQVRLPDDKRRVFLHRVTTFRTNGRRGVHLLDYQKLAGTLEHAAFVHTKGASRLPPIYRAAGGFKGSLLAIRRTSKSVDDILEWWQVQLRDASVVRQLYPLQDLQDHHLFVDASTDWGLGLLFDGKWAAWRLAPDWKQGGGRDICWLEAVALELLLLYMVQLGYTHGRFLIHSDNMGAIGAHTKGRSSNEHINLCVRRTLTSAATHLITTQFVYVPSADNPADPISRGILGPPHALIQRQFATPLELAPYMWDVVYQ